MTEKELLSLNRKTIIDKRYKIIRKIGSGAMGNVYLAKDLKLERNVAFKTINLNILRSEADLKEIKKRFYREAKAAAILKHPNLTTVYDVGEFQGISYIIMEYVEGTTLEDLLKFKKKLSLEEAVVILNGILEGISEAHKKNIIHRDLKPSNIIISKNAEIKITDFGLAKPSFEKSITHSGTFIGTANYVSPEQTYGKRVDARSDLWSIGVIFYEMLMGKKLFSGISLSEVILKVAHFKPTSIALDLPQKYSGLITLFKKLLDPQLKYRPRNAVEVKKILNDILKSEKKNMLIEERNLLNIKSNIFPSIRLGRYSINANVEKNIPIEVRGLWAVLTVFLLLTFKSFPQYIKQFFKRIMINVLRCDTKNFFRVSFKRLTLGILFSLILLSLFLYILYTFFAPPSEFYEEYPALIIPNPIYNPTVVHYSSNLISNNNYKHKDSSIYIDYRNPPKEILWYKKDRVYLGECYLYGNYILYLSVMNDNKYILYCINRYNGKYIYSIDYTTMNKRAYPRLHLINNIILISIDNRSIYAHEINTGNNLWVYELPEYRYLRSYGITNVHNDKSFYIDTIYYGKSSAYKYFESIDIYSGKREWEYLYLKTDNIRNATILYYLNSMLYYCDYYYIYALNRVTMDYKWKYTVDENKDQAPSPQDMYDGYAQMLYIDKYLLFFNEKKLSLELIDIKNAIENWEYKIEALRSVEGISKVRLSNDYIYFSFAGRDIKTYKKTNKIYVISCLSGQLIWSKESDAKDPLENNGVLLCASQIGGKIGKLYAYDLLNGKELWNFKIAAGYIEVIGINDNYLYLLCDSKLTAVNF